MGSAALQRLAVLHHGLDGVGVQRAGESLGLALHALQHGYGHVVLHEVGINAQHLLGLLLGLLLGSVGGVPLLPQKFRRAQEGTCAHLPAHHVAPLVAEYGQVTPGVYPAFVGVPDDGFRGGAYDEFLVQFGGGIYVHLLAVLAGLEPIVGYHGALLGEAAHVLCLA